MRFLFFTDTHIKGTAPKGRKDDFYNSLKVKFNEVAKMVHDLKVDYVLHGGDWFDRPDISPSVVRDFAVIIRSFDRPVFSVAGNHDLYGQNPRTISRTMLGLIEGIGIVKLIDYKEEIILEKENVKVQLTGNAYNYDIDGDNFRDYYVVKKRSDVNYAVNIVHGMLLCKPFFEGMRYTLLEDIKDTEADVTLAGHYHSGFGVKMLDGKYFINPGSLARVASTMSEIKRKPEVVLLDFTDGIEVREIGLKSALPGEEVLDREQLENARDRMMNIHEFYQGIAAGGQFEKVSIADMIEQIAANQELGENVKEEAIRRIGLARESLGSGDEDL